MLTVISFEESILFSSVFHILGHVSYSQCFEMFFHLSRSDIVAVGWRQLLEFVTKSMSPILPHLAEEVYQYAPQTLPWKHVSGQSEDSDSIFLSGTIPEVIFFFFLFTRLLLFFSRYCTCCYYYLFFFAMECLMGVSVFSDNILFLLISNHLVIFLSFLSFFLHGLFCPDTACKTFRTREGKYPIFMGIRSRNQQSCGCSPKRKVTVLNLLLSPILLFRSLISKHGYVLGAARKIFVSCVNNVSFVLYG